MSNHFNPAFREFLLALDFIFKWEGGISNEVNDYGGLTNVGITQDSYETFCNRLSIPYKSVTELIEEEIVDFYWLDRYIPSGADKLPYPLSLVMFDTSVLFSVDSSYSFINEYLYNDPEDYSDKGLEFLLVKLKEGLSPIDVAHGICDCREKEHRRVTSNDNSQDIFLEGWLNRLNDLREIINKYKNKNEHLWRYKMQTSVPS